MLPLWRDQVLIAVSPTHVSLLRLRGWFGKRQVVAKLSQSIDASKQNEATWRPAINALSNILKEPIWHKARMKVVISSSFVRYLLLPWSEVVLSAEEEQKLVKFKAQEIFGTAVHDWHISLANHSYGQDRLACGIDLDLLSKLRELASESRLTVQSIQPHLSAALNFWRRHLKDKNLHFLISDGVRLCVVSVNHGHLESLRIEQINGSLNEDIIASILHRETLINQEYEGGQAYLFAPMWPQALSGRGQSTQFKLLNLPPSYIHNPAAFLAAAHLA